MAYSDPERQREYQRLWMAERRAEYLADKRCVKCGSTEELEIDHIDSTKKVDHRIWSWSKERREVELKKCQVLCARHHLEKTCAELSTPVEKLLEVRKLRLVGLSFREIEQQTGVSKSVAHRVCNARIV